MPGSVLGTCISTAHLAVKIEEKGRTFTEDTEVNTTKVVSKTIKTLQMDLPEQNTP